MGRNLGSESKTEKVHIKLALSDLPDEQIRSVQYVMYHIASNTAHHFGIFTEKSDCQQKITELITVCMTHQYWCIISRVNASLIQRTGQNAHHQPKQGAKYNHTNKLTGRLPWYLVLTTSFARMYP